MTKKRRRFPYSRTLYSYMISYIGVVLMAFALLSLLLAWQVSVNMRKENLRVTKDKLYVACEDIQKQVEAMHSMAYQIASISDFRTVNFEQDKIKEAEMVERLKQFRAVSVLSNYFFLKYQNNDSIYTSDGTTLPFEIYCRNNIEEPFRAEVMETIDKLSQSRKENYVLVDTGSSSALLICPLKKYAVSAVGLNGCLCLEIHTEDVETRIEQMTGKLNGEMEVYYDDILISEAAEKANEPILLEAESGSKNVRITFRQNEDSYFLWENIISNGGVAILIGAVGFLLAVSVFLAWKNYMPIRKLAEKYQSRTEMKSAMNLEDIDILIETLLEKEERNNRRLQEQYTVLREQMLRLISSGGYTEDMKERLEVLNIHLPGPVYSKIECAFSDQTEDEKLGPELGTAMEDLAGEGTSIYAYREKERIFLVLLSAEEEYQVQEICEALHTLFEAREMEAEIRFINLCRNLRDLHRLPVGEKEGMSLIQGGRGDEDILNHPMEHLSNINGISKRNEWDPHMEASVKQNRKAKQAVKYIDENYTKYDLSLDSIAQEFHVTSTYLCRLIKQQTGISYKEYLTKLRMEEAKRLLKNPDIAIADVCQQIGYSNVSHFIKIFQKYEGITPAKFRDLGI